MLSLMPGLEEEHGESFGPTLHLLDAIGAVTGPQRHFRLLLLLLVQSHTARLAVLNVLLRRLPRFGTADGAFAGRHRCSSTPGMLPDPLPLSISQRLCTCSDATRRSW